MQSSAIDGPGEQTAQARTLALFASDVHLHPSLPKTTQAFFSFLDKHASQSESLYLLGDLFEYWAGDDDVQTPFNRQLALRLRMLAEAGVRIFWIAGNRDFLVGEGFALEAKLTLLPDPWVASIGGHEIVLTHGDALCTDDTSYMAFRSQVRNPAWQAAFLAKPLDERKTIIEGLRSGSKEAQRMKAADIMDVNANAVDALFLTSKTSFMIHGHTHRPAVHATSFQGEQHLRYVLPDWDCEEEPARGGWISIDSSGGIRRHGPDGAATETGVGNG